jgi:quinol monooxygenase YgiN
VKGALVVVEYIRYTVQDAIADRFAEAYQKAGDVLDADPHCLAYEVARGVEEPEHYVLHLQGTPAC